MTFPRAVTSPRFGLLWAALLLVAAVAVLPFFAWPASAQSDSPPDKPARPTAGAVGHGSITFSWADPGDSSITGYQVLRRNRDTDAVGDFTIIEDDTGTNAATYTDDTAAPSTQYAYRVKARNAQGLSPRSKSVRATTPAEPGPTPEPTPEPTPGPTPETAPAEQADVPTWAAEVTVGTYESYSPPMIGYSTWSQTGSVSDRDFELDGTTYRVLALVEQAGGQIQTGGLYLVTTLALPVEFTLTVGGQEFAASDSSIPDTAGTGRYWWQTDSELFASGETVSAGITTFEDTEASASRPLAPPAAYFSNIPSSHNGTDEFTLGVSFTEEVALSATTLQDHALVATGATIAAVEQRTATSTKTWNVTLQPEGTSDVTVELAATTACDQTGAVCTADGRQLHNQPHAALPGPASARLSDLTVAGLSLSPAFSATETLYTSQAPAGLTEVTVAAAAVRDDITVEIAPEDADTAAEGHQVALTANSATAITVTTTSADSTTSLQYWVTVSPHIDPSDPSTQLDPQDAQLDSLSFQDLPDMGFEQRQARYDVAAPAGVSETVVVANPFDADASVELLVVRSDDPTLSIDRTTADGTLTSGSIALSATGDTLALLRVNSSDGFQQSVYAVLIHRDSQPNSPGASPGPHLRSGIAPRTNTPRADDATLSGLTLTPGTLDPSFSSGTTAYTAQAESDTEHVTISFTTANTLAGTAISHADADTDTPGWQIALTAPDGTKPTKTAIMIIVRSADNSNLNTYVIDVYRAAHEGQHARALGSAPELLALLVKDANGNTVELTPDFASNEYSYVVSDPMPPYSRLRIDPFVRGWQLRIDVQSITSSDSDRSAAIRDWYYRIWGNGYSGTRTAFIFKDPSRGKIQIRLTDGTTEQIYTIRTTLDEENENPYIPSYDEELEVDGDGNMVLPSGCALHQITDTSDGLQTERRWTNRCNSHLEYYSLVPGGTYGRTTGYARFYEMEIASTGEVSIGISRRTSYYLVLREEDGTVIAHRHFEIDGRGFLENDGTPIVETLDAGTYFIEAVQMYSWLNKREFVTLDVDSDVLD